MLEIELRYLDQNNDINKVAKSINTIAYELISSISNRVVRVYLKD